MRFPVFAEAIRNATLFYDCAV